MAAVLSLIRASKPTRLTQSNDELSCALPYSWPFYDYYEVVRGEHWSLRDPVNTAWVLVVKRDLRLPFKQVSTMERTVSVNLMRDQDGH